MRKILFSLGLLVLLALPAAAQPAAPSATDVPAVSCADTAPDLNALVESLNPAPQLRACEHNFCSIQRSICESSCAPCGINFSCKNVQCESTCTCAC